jgi:hypothetical protein
MAKYINDIRQGDTVKIKLNYGASVDLTGFQYKFTLKSDFNMLDEDAELEVNTVAGDYTGDTPTTGIVYIVVSDDETTGVNPGKYYYTVKEISPAGEIRTLAPPPEDYKDKVLVAPEV